MTNSSGLKGAFTFVVSILFVGISTNSWGQTAIPGGRIAEQPPIEPRLTDLKNPKPQTAIENTDPYWVTNSIPASLQPPPNPMDKFMGVQRSSGDIPKELGLSDATIEKLKRSEADEQAVTEVVAKATELFGQWQIHQKNASELMRRLQTGDESVTEGAVEEEAAKSKETFEKLQTLWRVMGHLKSRLIVDELLRYCSVLFNQYPAFFGGGPNQTLLHYATHTDPQEATYIFSQLIQYASYDENGIVKPGSRRNMSLFMTLMKLPSKEGRRQSYEFFKSVEKLGEEDRTRHLMAQSGISSLYILEYPEGDLIREIEDLSFFEDLQYVPVYIDLRLVSQMNFSELIQSLRDAASWKNGSYSEMMGAINPYDYILFRLWRWDQELISQGDEVALIEAISEKRKLIEKIEKQKRKWSEDAPETHFERYVANYLKNRYRNNSTGMPRAVRDALLSTIREAPESTESLRAVWTSEVFRDLTSPRAVLGIESEILDLREITPEKELKQGSHFTVRLEIARVTERLLFESAEYQVRQTSGLVTENLVDTAVWMAGIDARFRGSSLAALVVAFEFDHSRRGEDQLVLTEPGILISSPAFVPSRFAIQEPTPEDLDLIVVAEEILDRIELGPSAAELEQEIPSEYLREVAEALRSVVHGWESPVAVELARSLETRLNEYWN